ncbi:hypothetical protein HDU78_001968 [Chytriomyces hyalinus]|nr:hypothetical protein HDU78_001968 [Chytriomyces hyalinus]
MNKCARCAFANTKQFGLACEMCNETRTAFPHPNGPSVSNALPVSRTQTTPHSVGAWSNAPPAQMGSERLAGQIRHFSNQVTSTSGGKKPCDLEELRKNDPMQWEPTSAGTDAKPAVARNYADVVHRQEIFKPRSLPVHTFVTSYKPSKISQREVRWLYVTDETGRQNIPPGSAKDLLQTAIDSASAVLEAHLNNLSAAPMLDHNAKAAMLEACRNKLLRIANDQQQTCGKWLIFCHDKMVDAVWAKVAAEVVAGNLGCTAKVSTSEGPGPMHVLCIYVGNCFDIGDVRRVFDRLSALGLSGLTFKMDLFTHLGIGANNPFGLSPCLYTASTITDKMLADKLRAILE